MGAAGSGIGRLGLKRELLACDDSLEKNPNGVGNRQAHIFGYFGRFFFDFFIDPNVNHCATRLGLLLTIEIQCISILKESKA